MTPYKPAALALTALLTLGGLAHAETSDPPSFSPITATQLEPEAAALCYRASTLGISALGMEEQTIRLLERLPRIKTQAWRSGPGITPQERAYLAALRELAESWHHDAYPERATRALMRCQAASS